VTDDQRPEDVLPLGQATIDRLAGVCRLWGVVQYFHPYLAYRDVDWDAALVETLPAVIAAESSGAYREAVGRLLGHLGDPVTRTLPPEDGGARAGAEGAPTRCSRRRSATCATTPARHPPSSLPGKTPPERAPAAERAT
jgi:hypothetical protein